MILMTAEETEMGNLLKGASIFALTFGFAANASATTWDASLWGKRRAFTEHVEKLAELVSQKTNGEFTINISYGGLSGPRENLDGLSIGAFQMAQFCASYHGDKNRALTVLELPFLGVETLEEEVAVSWAVYGHPAVQKEMSQWDAMLLMPSPQPQYNLVGTGDPIKSLSDFDGMRVRATGNIGAAFKELGAVPTSVDATETYNAMESGIVSTVAFAPHAHLAYGTINRADWWTSNLNPGTGSCPVAVSISAYKDLSDEHRKALDDSIEEALAHYVDTYKVILDGWDATMAEKGVDIVDFSPEMIKEFRSSAEPIHAAWIEEMTGHGLPASEIFDLIEAALIEYRAAK
jgi:TRAP-type C4-dicarboxylate transport system substrate-binding protein